MNVTRIAVITLALLLGGATSAHAAAKPPTDLTVGDRSQPLNVEGTPQFGWLVGSGSQSAYEIRVTRDGAEVWDSGRVSSSDQSYRRWRRAPSTSGACGPGTRAAA
jgi:alpha-L-rhamnosidase